MSHTTTFRNQVNGSMLSQHQGKPVSIFGNVIKTNPNGSSFDIQTGDNMVVTVNMTQPLTEPVAGLIEVQGISQGRTVIRGDSYMLFSNELAQTFDAVLDNEAVILCNSIANPWT